MEWMYEQPVKIYFGKNHLDILERIISQSDFHRGLLVCDPYFKATYKMQRLKEVLGDKIVDTYSDVSPNPDVSEVDACGELIRKHQAEFIIAIGGGSTMDLAKAASVLIGQEHTIKKYHGTGVVVPDKHIPVIAVPTTSGTGSEVTSFSVLTDKERDVKAPIASPSLYPSHAVVDYELTYSVPKSVTASTGIDVLSHAVEGYWSIGHQTICDALAIKACKNVMAYLEIVCDEPENSKARAMMAEASVLAGLAFALPKTTSSHACSYPLTQLYGIPHGEACGMTLDYFIRYNAQHDEDGRILALAKALGYESGQEFADKVAKLKEKIGLRTSLKGFNCNEEDVRTLVKASKHPNLLNNPCPVTEDILLDLYTALI